MTIDITSKVSIVMEGCDYSTALRMYRDLNTLISKIDLLDMGPDPYIRCVPRSQDLTSISYDLVPHDCRISGFEKMPAPARAFSVDGEDVKFPGGVVIKRANFISGLYQVAIYYESADQFALRQNEIGNLVSFLAAK